MIGRMRHRGLLAALRRQGVLAALVALVLATGATVRAYAGGLEAIGEEMCRVLPPGSSATPAPDSANADHRCCDLCICAFAAAAPAPAAPSLAARRSQRVRRVRIGGGVPARASRPRRFRLRDPPARSPIG